jgi:hypothetical protein
MNWSIEPTSLPHPRIISRLCTPPVGKCFSCWWKMYVYFGFLRLKKETFKHICASICTKITKQQQTYFNMQTRSPVQTIQGKNFHTRDRRNTNTYKKNTVKHKTLSTKHYIEHASLDKHYVTKHDHFFQTFANTYNIFKENTTKQTSPTLQSHPNTQAPKVHFIITSIDIHATHNPIQSHSCVTKSNPNTLCTS